MAQKLNIDRIWWRNVQPGEFYNIERHHQIQGGGGSLYIEIPNSIVPATVDFFDTTYANIEAQGFITNQAGVVGRPGESGPLTIRPKKGNQLRSARQNRQPPNTNPP